MHVHFAKYFYTMVSYTIYCLLFFEKLVKTFAFFLDCFTTTKAFGKFLHVNTVKAGNCECFFGNEGKDVKQRKFFTTNNKQ